MNGDATRKKDLPRRRDIPADLQAQLDALPGQPDPASGPEAPASNWSTARRFYKVRKEPISIRLDADVLDWLRSRHERYQVEINRILRDRMEAETG